MKTGETLCCRKPAGDSVMIAPAYDKYYFDLSAVKLNVQTRASIYLWDF